MSNAGGVNVKHVHADSVRNLGLWMDSSLSFDLHITKKCQFAISYGLHNLREIRKYLPQKAAEILVHGLVHSQLNFCNGLLSGLPNCQLQRLERLQNKAARIVTTSPFGSPSTPLLMASNSSEN